MVNIYNDIDKTKIYVDYRDLRTFPYGTGTLVYGINDLSISTESELIRFNSSRTGGEQFYVWLKELHFNGVQATKENVNELFQQTCFNCCGGGQITGDVKVDLTEIVNLLKDIKEEIKHISGGSIGDISEIMCALGDVDCALDNIAGSPIGHYVSVEECEANNELLDKINGGLN